MAAFDIFSQGHALSNFGNLTGYSKKIQNFHRCEQLSNL